MIRVAICSNSECGSLVEKGFLECRGIQVRKPDGSRRVEIDGAGKPIDEEIVLRPPGVVSPMTAVKIGFELSDGKVHGHTDGHEWFVFS